MHTIFTTPGFIISSAPYSEAGKLISIFTRDLGLVRAVAQGIRFEKSKLRYHKNDYSFGTFSLVRGKEVWRLTSAQENIIENDIGMNNAGNIETVKKITATESILIKEFWARIALLLRRLLQGEDINNKLFEAIYACYSFFNAGLINPGSIFNDKPTDIAPNLATIESLLVLRIMCALGYIGDDKDIHGFIYSNEFAPALLDLAARKKTLINQHINKALKESHL